MSAAATWPAVGSMLTTVAELDALPPFSVVLGDPDGLNEAPNYQCVSMQKRPGIPGYEDYWYPAWDGDIFNALASEEAVIRFHLGPFLVLWTPPIVAAGEAAA
ncbi:hypothetical protein ASF72_10530 [Arthrobacter sp. Leaf141]|uniref:hypothetical protein n=1 Tax=Arthrobacter sp. Leaf141 TaxID=1736273 RepID=UPI0006F49003|nr:hypothetical protein [Arthrobacter sp. Leaf141]KQR02462.1 hypothetical protein ASF72_10530 [Arthrobacter sp. Leaf141]